LKRPRIESAIWKVSIVRSWRHVDLARRPTTAGALFKTMPTHRQFHATNPRHTVQAPLSPKPPVTVHAQSLPSRRFLVSSITGIIESSLNCWNCRRRSLGFLRLIRDFQDNGTSKPHAIDQPLEEGRPSRVRSLEFLHCLRHCNAAKARTTTRMQQQLVILNTHTGTHTSKCKRGMGMGGCIWQGQRHANPNPHSLEYERAMRWVLP
jgi:hypothetical protein